MECTISQEYSESTELDMGPDDTQVIINICLFVVGLESVQ